MRVCTAIFFLLVGLSGMAVSAPGDLDLTFSPDDGKVSTNISNTSKDNAALAIQADGKLIVISSYYNKDNPANYHRDFAVFRYDTNGALDSTFGGDGIVTTSFSEGDDKAYAVTVQADGKILVAGVANEVDFALARYTSTGVLDTSFSADGKVTLDFSGGSDQARSVMVQSDGNIVVAGTASNPKGYAAARFLGTNGALDTANYGTNGKVVTPMGESDFEGVTAGAMQSDGKVISVGLAYVPPSFVFGMTRYNTNGSLDTGFSGDGKVFTAISTELATAYGVTVQPDGRVVVVGMSFGGSKGSIVRYNADGSLDTGFGTDGIATADATGSADFFRAVTLQADGKILAGGVAGTDFWLTRYDSSGSLDPSFSADGMVTTDFYGYGDSIYGLALQSDGKVVAAGYAREIDFVDDVALARYETVGAGWTLDVGLSGEGSIDSNPAGINCPGTCSESFSDGISVALTANPNSEWDLWSLDWFDACVGTMGATCDVLMDADKTVNAALYCDLISIVTIGPLTGVEPPWQCYVLEAINGFSVLGPSGDVTFEATHSISLGTDFSIGDGAIFKARIIP